MMGDRGVRSSRICLQAPLLRLLALIYGCAAAANAFKPFTLDFLSIPEGFMSFRELGQCTSGNTSYAGVINPATLKYPKSFFLEIGGGAVCFSRESCEDSSLRRWTDLRVLLEEFMGMSSASVDYLASGIPVPMQFMASVQPGWIPGMFGDDTHPLDHMRGIYLPACTADIGVGRVDAKYGNKVYMHHGGIGVRAMLTAVKELIPDLENFYLYGGSGGGVAAAAWMIPVADLFPDAKVLALVDSGFHMMPGTEVFKYFYNDVSWSHGPGEQEASKVYKSVEVPSFDWVDLRSIATQLTGYEGRVKIAYIGCDNDHIVYSDRKLMGKYITVYNDSDNTQVEDMWKFLTVTHKCAPEGSMFSWVAKCTTHHLTKEMGPSWAAYTDRDRHPDVRIDNAIGVKDFVHNFLLGKTLDPRDPHRTMFWYDNRTAQLRDETCPSSDWGDVSSAFPYFLGARTLWVAGFAMFSRAFAELL